MNAPFWAGSSTSSSAADGSERPSRPSFSISSSMSTCTHMHSHAITCNHMQSHAITCTHVQSHVMSSSMSTCNRERPSMKDNHHKRQSQEAITRGNHKRQSRGHPEAIKRPSRGSQWQSMAIRLTGLLVPARRSACAISPGSAPTYVRRCPRMSAASETPPSEMRSNLRPSAFAMDLPSEVFPTPGGPTRHLMRGAISEGHQRGSSVVTHRIGPRADEGGNQRGSSLRRIGPRVSCQRETTARCS